MRSSPLLDRAVAVAALGAVLALTACRDAAPDLTTPAPVRAAGPAASEQAVNGRYIVAGGRVASAGFAASVSALGGTVAFAHAAAGIAVVDGLSATAAATLDADAGLAVEADVEISPDPALLGGTASVSAALATAGASDPATALVFPRQWNLRAIGADAAWAAGRLGTPGVTVAILDSGIDYTHPDLAGRVDLARSVSFVPTDDAIVAALFPGRHPCTDLHFHGTHVAATVSSNAGTAAGVTSRLTLMCVKVLGRNNSGFTSAFLQGVIHAAENGADVINMSIAGGGPRRLERGGWPPIIERVLNYAHSLGVLTVVIAGNNARDLDHDADWFQVFCNSSNVVCVSATGPTAAASVDGPFTNVDAPAAYTNFGRSAISVAAPGGTPAGPVWAACSQTSLVVPICGTGTFVLGTRGTSIAAPHVSALAALLVEDIGKDRPSLVRARLLQSADDLGEPGTDPFYGKGRINVRTALGL